MGSTCWILPEDLGIRALCPSSSVEPLTLLKGSWDLVTRDIIKVTIRITPVKVLITLKAKSLDPLSRPLTLNPYRSLIEPFKELPKEPFKVTKSHDPPSTGPKFREPFGSGFGISGFLGLGFRDGV